MTPPPPAFQLRAARLTSTPRVFVAIVLMWLLPSYLLAASVLAPGFVEIDRPYRSEVLFQVLLLTPLAGGVFGAPWLLLTVVVWYILHRAKLASLAAALPTGLIAGLSVAGVVQLLSSSSTMAWPTATALVAGPLTALVVWLVAYAGVYSPAPYRPALFS